MAGVLWTPGNQLSAEMIALAQELNDKYPNLNLAWIPPEDRGPEDDKHFAIIQINSEGYPIAVIHRMSLLQVHGAYIFNWLWENDSQRIDVWDKFQREVQAEEQKKREQAKARVYELAEKLHAVATSPKHTYKMNGHKIGTDNEFPTLGLDDAS